MPRRTYLSEFELHILLALRRLGAEAYGVAVRQKIEERSGRRVWVGPLYTALARLERDGYVRVTISEPIAIRGGRSRKYYHLTAAGGRALRESLDMIDRMRRGLSLGTLRGSTR
ncbi:MAG TPA: helix-turn-helix transcriptional regulator [Gemmatimonadaceae bacterium]|nr:helix-turn-helix transcriptional regulator [Gemmatimonadaceae bacterium]